MINPDGVGIFPTPLLCPYILTKCGKRYRIVNVKRYKIIKEL